MIFATAALALFMAGFALGSNDDHQIPGDSPLQFCDAAEKRQEYTIDIENVDLTPNPPQAGQVLLIEAKGMVKEQIDEGAYVNLVVKYGIIKLIKTTADLCEVIKNVDMECPIPEGPIEITKSVELPEELPPGKYTVNADVFDKDNKHMTCLTATVLFQRQALHFLGRDL